MGKVIALAERKCKQRPSFYTAHKFGTYSRLEPFHFKVFRSFYFSRTYLDTITHQRRETVCGLTATINCCSAAAETSPAWPFYSIDQIDRKHHKTSSDQ